jgi:lactate dehydrogenase-like 2-hydroxyacid dehydrogenase
VDSRFLVTTAIPEPGLRLLGAAGHVTVLPDRPDYATLSSLCASGGYDVVLTQLSDTIDAPLLAAARIRGVSNFAVGFDNIDVDAATRGLDVFEDEPRLSPGLADLPNTVLLPHLGSATVPVRAEMARLSALNAVAMAEGRTPPHPVNHPHSRPADHPLDRSGKGVAA